MPPGSRVRSRLHFTGAVFPINNEQTDFDPRMFDSGSNDHIRDGLSQLSANG